MSDDPIPVAVVGAGNMGMNHVRVYDQLPEADLQAVVEPDAERASEIAEEYDVRVVNQVADIEYARAATVAVPNHLHREIAVACIEAGLDVLVEKPLAKTPEDAEAIAEAAADADSTLQVGHIERFNPAVNVLADVLADEEVIALETHRLGPFNEHLTEESVIFDLMIHDIDVIRSLVDAPVQHVDAIGTRSHSQEIDHAIAHLKFENGVLGTATASHVTHSKVRSLTAVTRDMFIEMDYQEQQITLSRRGSGQTTVLQGTSGYRTEAIRETPFIRTREPLKNELEHFLECVQIREQPAVGAEEGLRAVQLATDIVNAIRRN